MQNGTLKHETESLIFAAQEQAIRTNVIKGKMQNAECVVGLMRHNHIVSECPKLAQREYKRRHDWIGRRIHWKICGVNEIHVKVGLSPSKKNCFNRSPLKMMKNVFYFILNGLFVLKIFFILTFRSSQKNDLIRKIKLISKFITSQRG